MKLNQKQKEIIINNLFEPWDTQWLEMSFNELKNQEITIEPSARIEGWWTMFVNGRDTTDLNFVSYKSVFEEIKRAA